MRPKLGTWAWAEQTGGVLGLRDRLAMVAQGVRARAASRLRGREAARARHCDVADIAPPDSAVCRASEELCERVSEPFLYNHCLRSYFWARLLNDGRKFDDEAFYVAVLLHDLGLTDEYRLKPHEGACFTLPAARAAHAVALAHGWGEARAGLVADAICLHLNVVVDDVHGREAQLVRLGSGADVAGLTMEAVSADQRDAVVDRFPRLDMKANVDQALRREVVHQPGCRIAFLYKRLGFGRLVRDASAFIE